MITLRDDLGGSTDDRKGVGHGLNAVVRSDRADCQSDPLGLLARGCKFYLLGLLHASLGITKSNSPVPP